MRVEGIEFHEHIIDHALSAMNRAGFTLSELAGSIERSGGPYPLYTANRAADRTLQKLRKAGVIEWTGKFWRVTEARHD